MSVLAFFFIFQCNHLARNAEKCGRSLLIAILAKCNCGIFYVRGSVHHSIIHKENPTRCNSVSTFYFVFIWSSSCFGRHAAHHQEPKTALAASGFAYVEGWWTCSCWTMSATLRASSNYTSNNPPRMQNQRLLVQLKTPDDGRCVARNMLSFV